MRRTSPARLVVAGFAAAVALGTGLLLLPVSRAGSGTGSAGLLEALFTATSAVCVTGLVVVDTATFWSGAGQAVVVALIQVGGFGIMALATLLGLLVSQRLGVRDRLNAMAETRSLGLSDLRGVLVRIARTSLLFESVAAGLLAVRLMTAYDEPPGRALWLGAFHAVSAFNNAGFALYSDNLIGFATDPVVSGVLCVLVVAGGLGFPVLFELRRRWRRPGRWTLHTKIVLVMTGVLLVGGSAGFLALEWGNPGTLGPMGVPGKVVAGVFQGVQPRTAGFNSVDTGALHPETLLLTDVLMFIGGGQRRHRGRHQGHDLRRAAARHPHRGPRRRERDRVRPPHPARRAAPGPVGRPARRGRGRRRDRPAAAAQRLPAGRRAVRGRLGLLDRRPVHRHHRPS